MSAWLPLKAAMRQVGWSLRILGMVLAHTFSIEPWHVSKSAFVISKYNVSASLTARKVLSVCNRVDPELVVFSVLIGT